MTSLPTPDRINLFKEMLLVTLNGEQDKPKGNPNAIIKEIEPEANAESGAAVEGEEPVEGEAPAEEEATVDAPPPTLPPLTLPPIVYDDDVKDHVKEVIASDTPSQSKSSKSSSSAKGHRGHHESGSSDKHRKIRHRDGSSSYKDPTRSSGNIPTKAPEPASKATKAKNFITGSFRGKSEMSWQR
ncbi:MAG: hypothetical protein Q9166_006718 [cf. Caloplaca sp. 2 TL-2023]